MTSNKNTDQSSSCQVCGSKISANASRCLVCGSSIDKSSEKSVKKTEINRPKVPSITIALPLIIALVILFLAIGAGGVYAVMNQTGMVVEPTVTPTITSTATITITPTLTLTPTIEPSITPLPDLEYTVQSGDSCLSIAFLFNVSVNSIVVKNNLSATCDNLVVGQKLSIPQPTPTPSPQPTATLGEADATRSACNTVSYTVGPGDTLSTIAINYNVEIDAIRQWNGIISDVVYEGQPLQIPLCERLPTAGPTPTATNPPPYQAPSLLLPADGAPFTAANDEIALQWSSVGTLRSDEYYAVNIEDVTEGEGRRLVEYVTDTKFNVPANFRPNSTVPHILRWTVFVVRQTGSSTDGQAIYQPAGNISNPRTFIWWANLASTPSP
ncbi:MAG: LysM peptidoglycan-binding domain-containing protein [Anaerolineaceae bacterium]|nr:LysM peptidoglycan-binding domain-containing protein [Anaerolineaceae bacterium]